MSEFERLTTRSPKNNMPYLVNVKDDEQEVNGSYNTLKCIQDSWERLTLYEETGLSPEKVVELAKAKREGKLFIMPCKVGDMIYSILSGKVEPITVHGWRWSQHDQGWVLLVSRMISMKHDCVPHCKVDAFGKIVFLTKEESEKAIAKATETTPQPRENRF